MNCTAEKAQPRANLAWFINDRPVSYTININILCVIFFSNQFYGLRHKII